MTSKILIISQFRPNWFGHGGQKRSAQINHYFTNLGFQIEYFKFIEVNIFKKFFVILKNIYFLLYIFLKLKKIFSLKYLRLLLAYYVSLYEYKKNGYKLTILENSSTELSFVPLIAKQLKIKLLAFPHNIESLVISQRSKLSNKIAPKWIDEEIELFKNCECVFTISKEENWLLNIFGIKSYYFPYFPYSQEVMNMLLKIRSKRQSLYPNNLVIILGTVDNPPTYNGLLSIVNFLGTINEYEFNIIGFGTNNLNINCSVNVKIIGEVRVDELNNYLSKCKCVLINQCFTSGALTKIPELLIAGVPLVLNMAAARNYYNLQGLYVYEDISELPFILQQIENIVVPDNEKYIKPTNIIENYLYSTNILQKN